MIIPVSLVDSGILAFTTIHLGLIRRQTMKIIGNKPKRYISVHKSQWNTFLDQYHWLSHQSSQDSIPNPHHKHVTNTRMAHKSETGNIWRCRWCLIWLILLVASPHTGCFLAGPCMNLYWRDRQRPHPTTEEENCIFSSEVIKASETIESTSQHYSEKANGDIFVIPL